MTPDEISHHIAAQLAETGAAQRRQIAHIVKHLGPDRALELLAKVQQIESAGGMLTSDKMRRRTPGGVFFHLVYKTAPDVARQARQWEAMRKKRQADASAVLQKAAVHGETLPIASDHAENGDHPAAIKSQNAAKQPVEPVEETKKVRIRTNEKGCTVKITLVGVPTKVIDKGEYVKLSMVSASAPPALPKGLPTPAPLATSYVVVVSARQWKAVGESLASDPEDKAIIEGWPVINKEAGTIAVYATSATTKKLQQAKRSAQLVGAGK